MQRDMFVQAKVPYGVLRAPLGVLRFQPLRGCKSLVHGLHYPHTVDIAFPSSNEAQQK